MRDRNLDEAIRVFRLVVEKNKKYEESTMKLAECLKGRGVKHFAKGRYDQSYQDFLEALKHNPKDPVLRKFIKNVQQMIESLSIIGTKVQ